MKFGPLKRLPKENPIAVWDVETKPAQENEPINTAWLGAGLYFGKGNPEIHTDREAFFQRLMADDLKGHWIYAHNGSGFDFHFLLAFLCHSKIPWTAYRTGSRIFVSALDREFFDSAAILRGSLASIGKKLGLTVRKWDVPDDFYRNIEKYDWRAYLADDCRSLYEAIEVMRESFKALGASLRPTIAATAMCLFRAKYLHREIETLDAFAKEPDTWRKAYLGGRVEVFKRDMGHGYSWDINSSFPASMVQSPGVPCEFQGVRKVDRIPQSLAIVMADVDVPDSELHPPLGMIGSDDRLWFPTGPRRGWYHSCELEYCREKYGTKSVKPIVAHLFKSRHIFDQYVADLFAEKGKPGAIGESAKLALNSLYGKTGMRRERERIVCGEKWVDWPFNDPSAERRFKSKADIPHKRIISHGDMLYGIPDRANFATYIMPQIAGCVTARSRIRLQRLLDRAGPKACYSDTDSVYAELPRNAMDDIESKKLGDVKCEGEIESAVFAAPKTYVVRTPDGGEKGKAKGLRARNAADVRSFIAGASVPQKRVLGLFEVRRRYGEQRLVSEVAEKHAQSWSDRRHGLRAYSTAELRDKGIIERNS